MVDFKEHMDYGMDYKDNIQDLHPDNMEYQYLLQIKHMVTIQKLQK